MEEMAFPGFTMEHYVFLDVEGGVTDKIVRLDLNRTVATGKGVMQQVVVVEGQQC